MHHPTDRIPHTTAFGISIVEHWLEREIAQWVHPMKIDPMTHRTMSERSYHGATSRSLVSWTAVVVGAADDSGILFFLVAVFTLALDDGGRAGLKPNGIIAPYWAPRPILQTLVQADRNCSRLGPAPPKTGPGWRLGKSPVSKSPPPPLPHRPLCYCPFFLVVAIYEGDRSLRSVVERDVAPW